MFLSVIPHDWQREFNAWIANETGWLKQALLPGFELRLDADGRLGEPANYGLSEKQNAAAKFSEVGGNIPARRSRLPPASGAAGS